jgi:hypothetical protein
MTSVLEAICCQGKVAEDKDRDDAEQAVLAAQGLPGAAVKILKMLGQEPDEAFAQQLQKCAACVATRFEFAHLWVGCKPLDRGLPDCPKLTAH